MTPPDNSQLPELLPCPFCGEVPVFHPQGGNMPGPPGEIMCRNTACEVQPGIGDWSEAGAIDRWNRRAQPERKGPTAEEVRTDAGHPEKYCQDCGQENAVWFTRNDVWNISCADTNGILCPVCFMKKAEAAGFTDAWRIEPEFYSPEVWWCHSCCCEVPRSDVDVFHRQQRHKKCSTTLDTKPLSAVRGEARSLDAKARECEELRKELEKLNAGN